MVRGEVNYTTVLGWVNQKKRGAGEAKGGAFLVGVQWQFLKNLTPREAF